MANLVFNVACGKVAEKVADGATLKALVLRVSPADSVLRDFATVAAILGGGATEANFTNYTRKTLVNVTATVDHTNNLMKVDCDDFTFTSAGGAVNNNTTDIVIYEEVAGGDANCIPLILLDAAFTTDGSDINIVISANGLYGASSAT